LLDINTNIYTSASTLFMNKKSSCTSALVSGLDAATSRPDVGAGSVSGMWFKMGFS
jgi:hypothetical protein